jgi:two-component system chemotaxis response regulator CheY
MAHSALVVDDSDSMRRIVCLTLQSIGFTTSEASNGIEALARARSIKMLDLVIADMNMPLMDGIKLLSQVRRTPGISIVPFLLLTSELDSTKKDKARALGASGWLTKPFDPEQLAKAVRAIVR